MRLRESSVIQDLKILMLFTLIFFVEVKIVCIKTVFIVDMKSWECDIILLNDLIVQNC